MKTDKDNKRTTTLCDIDIPLTSKRVKSILSNPIDSKKLSQCIQANKNGNENPFIKMEQESTLKEQKQRESYHMKTICIAPIITGILTILSLFIIFPNHNLYEPLPQSAALYTIFMSFIIVLSSFYPGRKIANYLTNKKFKHK